jgi:nicotinamidase-related amidase
MTQANDYLEPLTPANAAVLFIDNQTTLMLGVQSIDTTLLRTNTEGLAKLAKLFALPVVLTTTGGGANGPSGPMLKPITETFPDVEPVGRIGNLNAMDDPRFAEAVKDTGRRKLILSGITTDFCLVYPALSLIAQGYHVFIPIDASGSWTSAINDAALQRLIQAGATPTNVQSIAGELQNSAMNADAEATKVRLPQMMEWFGAYTPAPSIIAMNGSYESA